MLEIISNWRQLVFHFDAENLVEQLKTPGIKPPNRKEGGEAEDEQPRPGTTQNNRSKGKQNEGWSNTARVSHCFP